MSPNELLQINRTQPFQPYTICLSDGTSYAVRHPDNVIVGVRTSYVNIPSNEIPGLADGVARIDNLHITEVVPLGVPA